ncbi:unnamed protein product [Effrenium voratum]|uniref:Jacalin-type lectin domain-containing protein n=1 Tax=Effrenium voratum TaxID=2562239 RepID=A0AA36JGB5_9DINO|nr:unnamed protein product [Effrenium voratum]
MRIQKLRSEHVPPAPVGIRIEKDGKQVPLEPQELRDFRFPPTAVEVMANDQQVETVVFRYPDGSYLTGVTGNHLGRSGSSQPAFQLMQHEFLTKITGYFGRGHGGHGVLLSVRFHSSRGRVSQDYGCQAPPETSSSFAFAAAPGTVLAAFSRDQSPCGCIEEACYGLGLRGGESQGGQGAR